MSQRRTALVVVAVAGLALVVVAALRVPWHWLPDGERLAPVDPRSVFTATQLRRAHDFSSPQRAVSLAGYAVSVVVALLLGLTPLGARLVGRLPRWLCRWWWVRIGVGTLLLLVVGELVTLPFSLVLRYRAVQAGLTRQSLAGWVRDDVVSLLVTAVYTALAAIVLVGLARRLPRTWPAWGALLSGLLVVLGSFVYPVAVEPLFNSFRPLPDGTLRTQILGLARTEHVHVDDVLVSDASRRTTELNAYVTGFGSTRRVVLWDNTVRDLPRAQILAVVAHELGHAEHDDVLLGTVLGAFGAAFGVGLLGLLLTPETGRGGVVRRSGATGPDDPRVLALLLALAAVGMLLAAPAENVVSRAIEARADRTGLLATRDAPAFEAMQRRLALSGLDEPAPPRPVQLWFGTHPTTLQRIGMARTMQRSGFQE